MQTKASKNKAAKVANRKKAVKAKINSQRNKPTPKETKRITASQLRQVMATQKNLSEVQQNRLKTEFSNEKILKELSDILYHTVSIHGFVEILEILDKEKTVQLTAEDRDMIEGVDKYAVKTTKVINEVVSRISEGLTLLEFAGEFLDILETYSEFSSVDLPKVMAVMPLYEKLVEDYAKDHLYPGFSIGEFSMKKHQERYARIYKRYELPVNPEVVETDPEAGPVNC